MCHIATARLHQEMLRYQERITAIMRGRHLHGTFQHQTLILDLAFPLTTAKQPVLLPLALVHPVKTGSPVTHHLQALPTAANLLHHTNDLPQEAGLPLQVHLVDPATMPQLTAIHHTVLSPHLVAAASQGHHSAARRLLSPLVPGVAWPVAQQAHTILAHHPQARAGPHLRRPAGLTAVALAHLPSAVAIIAPRPRTLVHSVSVLAQHPTYPPYRLSSRAGRSCPV